MIDETWRGVKGWPYCRRYIVAPLYQIWLERNNIITIMPTHNHIFLTKTRARCSYFLSILSVLIANWNYLKRWTNFNSTRNELHHPVVVANKEIYNQHLLYPTSNHKNYGFSSHSITQVMKSKSSFNLPVDSKKKLQQIPSDKTNIS